MHTLMIDDDEVLCEMLGEFMQKAGIRVDFVHEGGNAIRTLKRKDYDMVLLDVMLPGFDGFQILQHIRTLSTVPVIMLTARGDEGDRLKGFNHGADDYVPKPFSAPELLSRMRAITRRINPIDETIKIGELSFDSSRSELAAADGECTQLTNAESMLLTLLATNPGHSVSREQIYRTIFNREPSPYDRSLDTHICNLRRKIGTSPDGRARIRTARGIGYRLTL